jgi:hypothetical protein
MPAGGRENKNKRVKKKSPAIIMFADLLILALHQQQERQHPHPELQASMPSRIKPATS